MEAALQHQTERMESALQAQRTSSEASVDLEQERDLLKTEIAALKEQQQAFNIEYTRRAKLAQEEQATAERDRMAAVAAAQSANEAIEQELESIRSRQQRRLANVVCMAKQAHATVMPASSANPQSLLPALQTALECHRDGEQQSHSGADQWQMSARPPAQMHSHNSSLASIQTAVIANQHLQSGGCTHLPKLRRRRLLRL